MTRLNVVREGDGPIVVLSHALGCDLSMWNGVAAQLARAHTVIRYDHRNHGASEVVPGPLRIETLAQDAAELIQREAGGEPVHFVGLSMGGMTAQALAVRHPELLKTVVIANSSAHYPDQAPCARAPKRSMPRAWPPSRRAPCRAGSRRPLPPRPRARWLPRRCTTCWCAPTRRPTSPVATPWPPSTSARATTAWQCPRW
ncbi:alpha/beta fold hydrolase [Variovorax sp. E3]|uniref:alpha/beta fold hydrolase n=1 Tax=Variovorax sp. E3 TaxID=1914993 RepID=UPI0035B3B176